MRITERTIVSRTEPTITNDFWLDISGETPVLKSYLSGQWKAIGSAGGGSSEEDIDEAIDSLVNKFSEFQIYIKPEMSGFFSQNGEPLSEYNTRTRTFFNETLSENTSYPIEDYFGVSDMSVFKALISFASTFTEGGWSDVGGIIRKNYQDHCVGTEYTTDYTVYIYKHGSGEYVTANSPVAMLFGERGQLSLDYVMLYIVIDPDDPTKFLAVPRG